MFSYDLLQDISEVSSLECLKDVRGLSSVPLSGNPVCELLGATLLVAVKSTLSQVENVT